MAFQKASKKQSKLRLALVGVSGSGKTYSALSIAKALNVGRIALIDTEHGSASLYADQFDFDVLELNSFAPENYEKALHEAESGGYGVVIIDSLSHAWAGKDGILEIVDKTTENSKSHNSYQSWSVGTKKQNTFIETLLSSPLHLIVTMRSKADYVIEQVNGKSAPRKIGMAPIQREGVDYEFAIVGDIGTNHNMVITKTRCSLIAEDAVFEKPGKQFADIIKKWLSDGEPDKHGELLDKLKAMIAPIKDNREAIKALLKKEYDVDTWTAVTELPDETIESHLVNVQTTVKEIIDSRG